jgi:hypothetical protein
MLDLRMHSTYVLYDLYVSMCVRVRIMYLCMYLCVCMYVYMHFMYVCMYVCMYVHSEPQHTEKILQWEILNLKMNERIHAHIYM